MEKAEVLLKTWESHDGRKATVQAFDKTFQASYDAKAYIRNTFFGGGEKISFVIDEPLELSMVESMKELRKFARAQKKNTLMWEAILEMSERSIKQIFENRKVTSINDSSFDFARLLFLVCDFDREGMAYNRVSDIASIFRESDSFPSPKLTKQIIKIAQRLKISEKDINTILSVLSLVQVYAPTKNHDRKATVVLSVDPTDFVTASINDYNWTSCNRADGEYATMPYALLLDKYTMIAYIESERSRYVLFRDGEEVHTSSNKRLRRFIHLSENYKGLLMNKTYPNINLDFNQALINFFQKAGYGEQKGVDSFFEECVFNINTDHIYDDVRYSTNNIIVMGEPEDFQIGENPFCLYCGEINIDDPEDEQIQAGRGLCGQCAFDLNYAMPRDEDDEWNEDWDDEEEEEIPCDCEECRNNERERYNIIYRPEEERTPYIFYTPGV